MTDTSAATRSWALAHYVLFLGGGPSSAPTVAADCCSTLPLAPQLHSLCVGVAHTEDSFPPPLAPLNPHPDRQVGDALWAGASDGRIWVYSPSTKCLIRSWEDPFATKAPINCLVLHDMRVCPWGVMHWVAMA